MILIVVFLHFESAAGLRQCLVILAAMIAGLLKTGRKVDITTKENQPPAEETRIRQSSDPIRRKVSTACLLGVTRENAAPRVALPTGLHGSNKKSDEVLEACFGKAIRTNRTSMFKSPI